LRKIRVCFQFVLILEIKKLDFRLPKRGKIEIGGAFSFSVPLHKTVSLRKFRIVRSALFRFWLAQKRSSQKAGDAEFEDKRHAENSIFFGSAKSGTERKIRFHPSLVFAECGLKFPTENYLKGLIISDNLSLQTIY
jgi:hypothetical protein